MIQMLAADPPRIEMHGKVNKGNVVPFAKFLTRMAHGETVAQEANSKVEATGNELRSTDGAEVTEVTKEDKAVIEAVEAKETKGSEETEQTNKTNETDNTDVNTLLESMIGMTCLYNYPVLVASEENQTGLASAESVDENISNNAIQQPSEQSLISIPGVTIEKLPDSNTNVRVPDLSQPDSGKIQKFSQVLEGSSDIDVSFEESSVQSTVVQSTVEQSTVVQSTVEQSTVEQSTVEQSTVEQSDAETDHINYSTVEKANKSMDNHIKLLPVGEKQENSSIINKQPQEQMPDELLSPLSNMSESDEGFTIHQKDQTVENIKSVPQSIMEQVVEKTTLLQKDGKTELTVQLKPDTLGTLSIRLTTEKGFTTVKIIADSFQTKELIQGQISSLKQQLGDQGIKVKEFEIVHEGGEFLHNHADSGGNPSNRGDQNFHFVYRQQHKATKIMELAANPELTHTGLINYLV
ncbi:MAG: flagellar hook-length control protein FliK [Firmicutes bacterium]|nr:flagellar hook-length control protein FliK [Bacillota bacterium]